MMQSYRKLQVWNRAMDLVDAVYRLSNHFPKEENFGLTSQLRRCAVSIPSNIAEGAERSGKKEFQQFIAVAYGSLAELETQLEIAYRQNYISQESLNQIFLLTAEVGRMLNGLSISLDRKLPTANRQLQEA